MENTNDKSTNSKGDATARYSFKQLTIGQAFQNDKNHWCVNLRYDDVIITTVYGIDKMEALDNASRIALAVNIHDELAKALKKANEYLENRDVHIAEFTSLLKRIGASEEVIPVVDIIDVEEEVYNLTYLREIMGHKKPLIKEIIEVFLKQCPLELESLMDAILRRNYSQIREICHRMKSSTNIMGMLTAHSLLDKIECLAKEESGIENIHELNSKVNLIFLRAFKQIKAEKI